MRKKDFAKSFCLTGLATLLALAATESFAGECTPASSFKTLEPGVLKVTSAVVPPYIIQGQDGQPKGVDNFVISQFAKENCLTVKHQFTDSAAAIQYVVASRSDIAIGAWYRTSDRAKVLGVTAPVYLEQTAIYSHDGATQFEELKGRKVGTVQGYLWVPELKKLYGSDLSLYPTAAALAQDLTSGRIQAAVNTYSIGVETQKEGGMPADIKVNVAQANPAVKSSVYPAQAGYLYSKNNPELGQAVNSVIEKIQKDGTLGGELANAGLDPKAAETGAARYADQ